MKVNLPVSDVEHPYPQDTVLVSETDLKGIITYANQAFVNVSGYGMEELLGQNHNVVRHPDMPPEAFADLWATVKGGRPWRGIVKNRCKNGDYYWVDATVVPVRKNNQTQGYMSVRRRPSRQQVEAADALYRSIREGKAKLHSTRPLDFIYRFSFQARYTLFALLMAALAAGAALAGAYGMSGAAAGLVAAAVVLALLSVAFVNVSLTRPLERAIGFFDQIAQGNLNNDIEVAGKDITGGVLASLAYTQTHLRVIIDEIAVAAHILQQRSAQLETEVARVAAHSEEQHDRVARVSAAMEEVSVSVTEVASSAEDAEKSARSTLAVVKEGNTQMTRSMDSVSHVVRTVQTSSETINELSQSIQKIGVVTQVIKEIAEQTNLLALNAAIEAARAGEQGRGFAVVADEVRKLAERTTTSTTDIARIVDEIQRSAGSAVSSMGNAVQEVNEGIELLRGSQASLDQITRSSEMVTEATSHIASATGEQSAASEDVAKNMEQISSLIEENGASVAQVKHATDELAHTAQELRKVVEQFTAA